MAKEIFGLRVFALSGPILERALIQFNHPALLRKLVAYRQRNDYQPEDIVNDKPLVPPGGSVHDYYSQAPYWFPDPARPDGLPYINRDGEINPESNLPNCDKNKKDRMFRRIYIEATLFWFTREEQYAKKAAQLLHVWFLDPATRMNPNVNYGQAIPGICSGRDAGIIEFHFLIQILDAVDMIAHSTFWSREDHRKMQQWMTEFLVWMRSSKIGHDEEAAANNHGTWFAALAMKIASFCGKEELVVEYVQALRLRLSHQILPDGSMPTELRRTQAWSYSIFCLSAWLAASVTAAAHGLELYGYRDARGVSISTAIDYLCRFAIGREPWPYPELYRFAPELLSPVLRIAAFLGREYRYANFLKQIPATEDYAAELFFGDVGGER